MIKYFSDIKGAPKAIGPYSVATETGNLVFLSGQIPLNPETGEVAQGGIEEQSVQVLKNISAVLGELGLSFKSVAKTTIFLTTMDNFGAVNKIYEEFLGDSKPARSTVAVAGLPRGVLVEIEMIAVRG